MAFRPFFSKKQHQQQQSEKEQQHRGRHKRAASIDSAGLSGPNAAVDSRALPSPSPRKLDASRSTPDDIAALGTRSDSDRGSGAAGGARLRDASADPAPGRGGREEGNTAVEVEKKKLRVFEDKELRLATEGFSDKRLLGEGSFGKVYRGRIAPKNGSGLPQTVAVKVLNEESLEGMDEMLNEVLVARALTQHPNLVRLVGYLMDHRDAMLVYEFCPNGTVETKLRPGEYPRPKDFPWDHRVRVMLQTAQALNCLHEHKVIHRNLTLANLLLDEADDVKLSDFGMAKEMDGSKTHVSTRVMGTKGYLDPNYGVSGKLREKSDVFSLGIIMLELLSGRRAMDPATDHIMTVLKPMLTKRPIDVERLIDPGLEGQFHRAAALRVAKMAKMCTEADIDSRPELKYVIADLESALAMSTANPSSAAKR